MTGFAQVWTELAEPGQPLPYLLIDAAGIEGGAAQLPRYIFSEVQCLLVGSLALDLADVAPYLGQLKSLGPDVARTTEKLMLRQAGTLVVLPGNPDPHRQTGFSQLYRHFRKCNMVQGPQGEQLFFRYYDPRVLEQVLPLMDASQIAELFGPIDRLVTLRPERTVFTWKNVEPPRS